MINVNKMTEADAMQARLMREYGDYMDAPLKRVMSFYSHSVEQLHVIEGNLKRARAAREAKLAERKEKRDADKKAREEARKNKKGYL